jgi:hypothetical protein
MTENTVKSQSVFTCPFIRKGLVLLNCAAVLTSGCSVQKKPRVSWSTAVLVKPTVPPSAPQSTSETTDPAPELRLELPPPLKLATVRVAPPRPRAASSPSADVETDKPEIPLLAPQLSAEEKSNAQQQVNTSISAAEKNLESTRGKTLNAVQADMASKVRGFITDTREAANGGDWPRARNLAKKAQVLSEQLAGML